MSHIDDKKTDPVLRNCFQRKVFRPILNVPLFLPGIAGRIMSAFVRGPPPSKDDYWRPEIPGFFFAACVCKFRISIL